MKWSGILILSAVVGVSALGMFHLRGDTHSQEINANKKVDDCKKLTLDAIQFLKREGLDAACRAFATDTKWRLGEIEVFIFSEDGYCYIFGSDRRFRWRDFQTKKTPAQEDFVAHMVEMGVNGGMVSFAWNNSYMRAYVQNVVRDGRTYIIGAGFYPDSGKYLTEQLVSSAAEYAAQFPVHTLFERVNNPVGQFVRGDIYLVIYDDKGFCVAHGKSLELVGQNLIEETSDDGKYIVRDILQLARTSKGPVWYEYLSREGGVLKAVYVQRIEVTGGKHYVLVGGYYPTINEGDVRGVVEKAVSFMRTHGAKQSFAEFSQPRGRFAQGGITLFVYDMQGNIVADMANPAFVGQNLMNSVDADGRFITKTIIHQANKNTSGWVSFNLKKAYNMMYIKKVKLPDGDFVVGAAYYPIGKQVSVRFMVEKASRFLEQTSREQAFSAFCSSGSEFLRGDVWVTVYDKEGVLFVDGPDRNKIWVHDLRDVDAKGVPIVKNIIRIAQSGGGWYEYKLNNRIRRVYAKEVIKTVPNSKHDVTKSEEERRAPPAREKFIVVSGYYL